MPRYAYVEPPSGYSHNDSIIVVNVKGTTWRHPPNLHKNFMAMGGYPGTRCQVKGCNNSADYNQHEGATAHVRLADRRSDDREYLVWTCTSCNTRGPGHIMALRSNAKLISLQEYNRYFSR